MSLIEKENIFQKHFKLKPTEINEEEIFNKIIKEAINEENNKKISENDDKINFGNPGWKDRYYLEKFNISNKLKKEEKEVIIKELKEKIKKYYIEGLSWVFEYYYNGCISWSWFYTFHYAPLIPI